MSLPYGQDRDDLQSDLPDDQEDDQEKGKSRPSAATRLVQLAEDDYELGCTSDGEPYGMPKTGPRIIRQLRGGRSSLRAELARAYYAEYGSAPSQSALADALTVLEGKAQHEVTPVDLHLRVAECDGALLVDLGDQTGNAIEITAAGWTVVDFPKVRFRRTALTAPLPEPVRGSSFEPLWSALNVEPAYRPIVLAILVADLIPSIPHPVVLISGEHGTGKTTATNRLGSVVDPSTVGPRKAPRDAEAWVVTASASWVVCLDNLSGISEWLSDAMCRAATGEGDARRRLYSDDNLTVFKFRRCLIVNGIDVGALKGDLADRLVHIVLERIPDTARRTELAMAEQWQDAHPKVLGALLDLAVKVLQALPGIELASMPRMADFARVLAAVDKVHGTDGMSVYLNLRQEQAEEIAESDPVIVELRRVVVGEITATSAEILDAVHPVDDAGTKVDERRLPKDWPATARQLTAHMNRIAPTLRQLGWTVEKDDRRRGRPISWSLTPPSHDDPERQPANGAPDAPDAPGDKFPQVTQGASEGASQGACGVRPDIDAPEGASRDDAPTDAPAHAPGAALPLISGNGAKGASGASGASDPSNLCATCSRAVETSLMPDGRCRRCHFSSRAAS